MNKNIKFISKNKDGNYYIGYSVNAPRGMHGKDKGHVEELIIVGMNKSKFKDFCKREGIEINECI